jgi:hypothetical protein
MAFEFHASQTISPGVGGGEAPVNMDWLPRTGKRGGRLELVELMIACTGQIDTGSGDSLTESDLASLLKGIRIHDAVGPRINLTGNALRVIAFHELGLDVPEDPAVIAASATDASRTYYHVITFAPPRAYREIDYAIPCEDLREGSGGLVAITPPALSDILCTTGAALDALDSISYRLHAKCIERDDIDAHPRLCWEQLDLTGNTEALVPVNDRLLRAMVIWKKAAGNGTATSTVTSVTCPPLGYNAVTNAHLRQAFMLDGGGRDRVSTRDPFYNGKALPILFPKLKCGGEKWSDMLRVKNALRVQLDSTMATPSILYSTVDRVGQAVIDNTRAAHDLNGGERVKTAGKTQQDPASWKKLSDFVVKKLF